MVYAVRVAKTTIQFVCNQCGGVFPKWAGKCVDCGAWDSLEEVHAVRSGKRDPQRGEAAMVDAPRATAIAEVSDDMQLGQRWASGIAELDRVLGGGTNEAETNTPKAQINTGLVPGSAVMIGGDPGIGKSTLMLQAAAALARKSKRVLYVTSEESAHQLRMRAQRLAGDLNTLDDLFVLADTNLARILEQTRQIQPDVLVIDSIQMIYKSDLAGAAGSVTQLRTCCQELVYFAKASGVALLLVGHVTKEGRLAGPRLLEHMVDTVLYFEGDRYHSHRVIRAVKNRFGTTLEVGLFEMRDVGLVEVPHGSGLLAKEYQVRSGSVICPVMQGTRCLLIELQALTATGILGAAKRKVSGLDANRLAMLIAVLEKRGGLRLADQDIFASSVGGMRVAEPAADLALALAIATAHHNRSMPEACCAVGEIGLGGEIRSVQHLEQRLREAVQLGFKQVLMPPIKSVKVKGLEPMMVRTLADALEVMV